MRFFVMPDLDNPLINVYFCSSLAADWSDIAASGLTSSLACTHFPSSLWSTITQWSPLRSELQHWHDRGFRGNSATWLSVNNAQNISEAKERLSECSSCWWDVPAPLTSFLKLKEYMIEGMWEKTRNNSAKDFFFFLLCYPEGNCLERSLSVCSPESLSVLVHLLYTTHFQEQITTLSKKPFWGSQRLIYLLLCCGSKQSTKSTILQL